MENLVNLWIYSKLNRQSERNRFLRYTNGVPHTDALRLVTGDDVSLNTFNFIGRSSMSLQKIKDIFRIIPNKCVPNEYKSKQDFLSS